MRCSQGSEGRSSIGRRLAAVAAGMVAAAMMVGCSLTVGTVANAQEGDSPLRSLRRVTAASISWCTTVHDVM